MLLFIKLLIGLFIFLAAMKIMTHTLQQFSQTTLTKTLQYAVGNPLNGILFGTCFTALVQSSSAITVLVVSLVEAQLLTLYQAANIIIGSNLGTTLTSQLLCLNLTACIPFFLLGGLILYLMKKPLYHQLGCFFLAFGFLFLGLHLIKIAMIPVVNSYLFSFIIGQIQHAPLLCILLGMSITFIIQSSSATTAILITLLSSNAITISTALFILLGLEIGTCLTALLASLSGGRAGKQTALFHLFFNVTGVLIFFPLAHTFIGLTSQLSVSLGHQLANLQLVFNLFSVICLFPFTKLFIKLIHKLLPIT